MNYQPRHFAQLVTGGLGGGASTVDNARLAAIPFANQRIQDAARAAAVASIAAALRDAVALLDAAGKAARDTPHRATVDSLVRRCRTRIVDVAAPFGDAGTPPETPAGDARSLVRRAAAAVRKARSHRDHFGPHGDKIAATLSRIGDAFMETDDAFDGPGGDP